MRSTSPPQLSDTASTLTGHPQDGSVPFGLPVVATSFIGREHDVEQVVGQLVRPDVRLLTLTGPGGVGKTRLAREAASRFRSREGGEVLFLPLASILDPGLVAPAIGQAVGLGGVEPQTLPERIAATLEDQRLLLVLDNFEQILPAAPLVAQLVASCPSLQVLVTSRSPLSVSTEHEIAIRPLELPGAEFTPDQVAATPSAQLFIERASLSAEELSPGTMSSIAAICQRLDGLPLAIELAAARTRIMAPPELLDRMDQALPLLTAGPVDAPPRLRSMRDAIAWSYNLLSSDEQALFRALSVFQGGFALAAAEAVAPESSTVPFVAAFQTLVQSSLVQRTTDTSSLARFALLETVREFGIESLTDRGEDAGARDRHLAWYTEQLGSPTPEQWFLPRGSQTSLLPGEHDNLRSALNWALDRGEIAAAAHIAWGLLPFWWRNGLYVEAEETLERIGEQSTSLDPIVFAGVMCRLSEFAYLLGDFSRSRALAGPALDTCRDLAFPLGVRTSIHRVALATQRSDAPEAIRLLTEAVAISRSLGNAHLVANDLCQRALSFLIIRDNTRARKDLDEALSRLRHLPNSQFTRVVTLAFTSWLEGSERHIDVAEQHALEALAISNEFGFKEGQYASLHVLGEVAITRGDIPLAANHFQSALQLVYQKSIQHIEGFLFAELAMLAQTQGDLERAARLYGAADTSWQRHGISDAMRATMTTWNSAPSPSPESIMSEPFASAYAAGRNLSRAEAYAEAIAFRPAPGSKSPQTLLSARESEVLQLIATGHTNREIAEALFVSKRTIDGHVASILAKLGVDTRREAVAMARQRGLLVESPAESGSTG